jgi:two-component system, OmpR family, sensor kinase
MSLATRLSAFFLIAMAVVLAGFSGALYVLARNYLVRELDERLQNGLDTLEASVDIEPGGLEWEPADRRMTLGVDHAPTAVRWAVRDGTGALVDHSANTRLGNFPDGWQPAVWPSSPTDATAFGTVRGWRLAARRLRLDELLRQGRGHPDDEPGYEVQYPRLDLVVGLEPGPVQATLSWLGFTLASLSIVVWLAAAAAGRWLCMRALAPVRRMARAASAMSAANMGQRLPLAATRDELDDLGHAFNDLLDRLNESFVQLNQAYDRQRRFAGDASHQLRTPIAALLGQAQVALKRDRTPDEYRRFLTRVESEGGRLRQIIESLLLLAQPEGVLPEPTVVDLADWVPDHLERWASHPRASDLRTEIAADGSLCVRAHPALLAQLVDNLLENACKYSTPATPIVVRAWRENGTIALGVEDRGCGLADDDLTRVFEPFFRTELARTQGQPGVGLGLAVAQRIAATAGGTLVAESQPGTGSFFVLRLPEAQAPPHDEKEAYPNIVSADLRAASRVQFDERELTWWAKIMISPRCGASRGSTVVRRRSGRD